jgi:hypothetical protein
MAGHQESKSQDHRIVSFTFVDAAPLIIILIRTQHSSRTCLNQMHTTTGHAGYGVKAVILAVVGGEALNSQPSIWAAVKERCH